MDAIATTLAIRSSPAVSKPEVEKEVERQVALVRAKIEQIEARLPAEAVLDKVASVNDAILATRLEALDASIRELKDKLLTKWDVVVIVFGIIGGLGGMIGILKFATSK